jgi:hypothetical protein
MTEPNLERRLASAKAALEALSQPHRIVKTSKSSIIVRMKKINLVMWVIFRISQK